MTTEVSTKVRLVRCPKCRQLLPEPPEVPLYKCGGCFTTLRAKYRKVETNHSELSSQERDSVAKDQQHHDLEEKEEARSSNHDFSSPPMVESSPDESNIRCQDERGDCSTELCEAKNVSEGISSSPEVTSLQNEDSPEEDKESSKCDNPLGQNSKRFHVKVHDDERQWTVDRNFSAEFSSSGEFTREAEAFNSDAGEHVEQGERVDQMEHEESKGVWQEDDKLVDEVQNLPECEKRETISPAVSEQRKGMQNNNVPPENDEKSHICHADQNGDFDGGNKHGGLGSSSGIISCENNNISKSTEQSMEVDDGADSQLPICRSLSTERNMNASLSENNNISKSTEQSIEVDDGADSQLPGFRSSSTERNMNASVSENNNISKSTEQSIEVDDGSDGQFPIFRSSSTEINMNASVGDSIVAPQSPLNESLVSLYLSSLDDERLDQSLREGTGKLGRISSVDTFGSSPLDDLSSELNSKHPSMTNYAIGSYDAYDGSESSYDGTDDQIREHASRPSRKNKNVDYVSTKEMLRRERFRVNNVMSSELERNYWATSSSHRATKSSSWSQDKSAGTNRYTSANRMRLDKQGADSRIPFASRDPLAGHRIGGISNYGHDSLPPRHGLNSSAKPSHLEPDNMDLLRTVWELEDQLNRMQLSKVMTNRRFPAEVVNGTFTPFYYNHRAPEREIYADHPSRYNPRYNQAQGHAERCNISRLAFPGEAARYRHQVSCSCLHCCPQDWHYSAQLPSRSLHHENGHHVVHNDHNCCNMASPLHYTSSEHSLWGSEMKSDNQRPDELERLPLKEKYHTVKRHLRPIAGGAPIISCYYCSEVLQLPVDFLLFKRRYHRLICNACKKVLKFSLQKGAHIVPHLPDASAPPPSEVDDYNDARSRRNLDPLSHSSSRKNAERVSWSDDYGPSFCRSCSTEGEASVVLPSFDHAERNSYNRKKSLGSSYEPMEDGKMRSVVMGPQNKNVSSMKNVESVGSSSEMPKWRKATSEIEELPPSSNSPLHRLMGYSSPSQVLNR
ncbi:hypothetical protein CDL12_22035 [Handroanthus impetiginosus]|uniref:Uncharacterized protein n=1 Tax=Handroanthus impetiginosus TaxID=429701 RepID=A0A2G9GJE2_9LAMI|nr:hypothetical protein CDL12_22035 [Handroanthus impetiginosus]